MMLQKSQGSTVLLLFSAVQLCIFLTAVSSPPKQSCTAVGDLQFLDYSHSPRYLLILNSMILVAHQQELFFSSEQSLLTE